MTAPVRTCVGCRQRLAQAGLRRFVRRTDGWQADAARRSDGRGVYLCSPACAERVAKNKRYPGLSREALVQWEFQSTGDLAAVPKNLA